MIRELINNIYRITESLYDEYYDEQDYYRELFYEGRYTDEDNEFYNRFELNRVKCKHEWIEIFQFTFKEEKNFKFCTDILNLLSNYSETGIESDMLEDIRRLFRSYKKQMSGENRYPNYFKSNALINLRNKVNIINDEIRRYNSFSSNQDVYDNILSIIKIFQKIKHYYEPEFDFNQLKFNNNSSKENEKLLYDYRDNLLRQFQIIRFII